MKTDIMTKSAETDSFRRLARDVGLKGKTQDRNTA